jgi:predicted SprT family Zn-dependent metalloprotease
MRPWAHHWGLPGLEGGIRVRFDGHLRRSLGRCRPDRGEISLHPALAEAAPREVAAVLCHEVAHVAAFHLYGAAVPPHGPEWAALVAAVGHAPVTAKALQGADTTRPAQAPRVQPSARRNVLHICPVCQTARLARRVVHGWRCAECVAAGLDGKLEITVQRGSTA